MTNSDEQMAFFAELEFGTGNSILESVAGSGKTTSIVQGLNYIDDEERILCTSFTKLAAQQLDRRIRSNGFTNVTSSTLNSVGWGVCRANIRGIELDANKTILILKSVLGSASLGNLTEKKIYESLKGPVKRLVGYCKSYVLREEGEQLQKRIMELADYHGVDIPEGTTPEAEWARDNIYRLVMLVYKRGIEAKTFADWDDQKFFPVWFGWGMPVYNKIIVDECQDSNHCDIEMVKLLQMSSPGSRTIWVGDRMQAIYLFRGSLLNAMDVIKDDFNCKYLTLSVCWRCADDILDEAKTINPLIKSPIPNPKGKGTVADVSTGDFLDRARVGDYVICRTTAPLVKRCLQLVRKNVPAKVKGREVGRTLLNLINKIAENWQGFNGQDNATLLEFIQRVSDYRTQTVAALEAANRDEAATRISDECEALTHFCTEAKNVDEVARKIDSLFTDDENDNSVVLLLTGHKSKGLENDRVWFLRPDLSPFPKAKTEHEQEAERRLRYVILTRAALERYHVIPEPDEVKPNRMK